MSAKFKIGEVSTIMTGISGIRIPVVCIQTTVRFSVYPRVRTKSIVFYFTFVLGS